MRQDITEGRAGTPVPLRMKIIVADNCLPMPDVRVNIWHCDKDGNYSGYGSEVGETYMRGYQFTDANGEVEFQTILPGWYPGRVCHLHFQVYVNENYAAISQLTFDHDKVNEIYADNPTDYTRGPDPLTPENDGTFSDGYDLQLAEYLYNSASQRFFWNIEVTVQGSGLTATSNYERLAAKLIEIKPCYPNPYKEFTNISYRLLQSAEVEIDLWSLDGKKLQSVFNEMLSTGEYSLEINPGKLGLSNGNYLYQIAVSKDGKTYRISKMMTSSG